MLQDKAVPYWTSGVAARHLGIDKKTLLRAVRRGELTPASRTPRGYARFLPDDVLAYARHLAGSPTQPQPATAAPALPLGQASSALAGPLATSDSPPAQVGQGLTRLAALSSTGPELDADAFIQGILALLADSLTVGLTFLSRVEGTDLHIEGVYDRAGMGLQRGAVIPLCDTY